MDRRADTLRHFPTLFSRWKGARAWLEQLTSTHQTLSIRLTRLGSDSSLRIACIGPGIIRSPIAWQDADVSVEIHPAGFVVRDSAAGVEITSTHIEISEH